MLEYKYSWTRVAGDRVFMLIRPLENPLDSLRATFYIRALDLLLQSNIRTP